MSIYNFIPKLEMDIEQNMIEVLDKYLPNGECKYDPVSLTRRVKDVLSAKDLSGGNYPATHEWFFSNDLNKFASACWTLYSDYSSRKSDKDVIHASDNIYHIMISFILSQRVDLMAKGIYGLNLIGNMDRAAPWWGLVLEIVSYKAEKHPYSFIVCLYQYLWGWGYDGYSPNVTIDIIKNEKIQHYIKSINLWQTYDINKDGKWRFKERRNIPEINQMCLETEWWEDNNPMMTLLEVSLKKGERDCVEDNKKEAIKLFPQLGLVFKFLQRKRTSNVYLESGEKRGL